MTDFLNRSQLAEDGYSVVDQYLDPTLVRFLIDAIAGEFNAEPALGATRVKRGIPFARRNLLSAEWLRSFITTREVRSLVDGAAADAVAVRAIVFDKTGDANWTVPWHQDRSIAVRERIDVSDFGPWSTKAGVVHVQPPVDVLRRMVTLRFSLDPCGPNNGPLRVIPGTHHSILDAPAVEEAVGRLPATTCATAAGGVVVMRPLILHASSPAKTVDHRRVLHIEFGPPALPGGLHWAGV